MVRGIPKEHLFDCISGFTVAYLSCCPVHRQRKAFTRHQRQWPNPNTNVSSTLFGTVNQTQSNDPRFVQIAIRFSY